MILFYCGAMSDSKRSYGQGRSEALPQIRVKPASKEAFLAAVAKRGLSIADCQREAVGEWTKKMLR